MFAASEHGQPISKLFSTLDEWPWTWLRILNYVRRIHNVYERIGMDPDPETATPARWMFWDAKALDKWFDERRDSMK